MRPANALFVSALAPAALAFEFTMSPDPTDGGLNLSETVTLEWTHDRATDGTGGSPWLEFRFHSGQGVWQLTNNSERIDWRTESSWTWDAPEWFDYMEGVGQKLGNGETSYISAAFFRNRNDSWTFPQDEFDSDKFDLIDYPHRSGATARTQGMGMGLAAGLALAAAVAAAL